MIGIASVLTLIVAPLLIGVAGLVRRHRAPTGAALESEVAWNWKLTSSSALLYALAFNLTFFVQELFLVLPKALTPGLRPTLFHNNHRWEGEHPLASLFQGTGVLAILLTGFASALLLRRGLARSNTIRLFLIWMAYNGFFQALPQVVIGAVSPRARIRFIFYVGTLPALAAILLIIPFRVPRDVIEVVALPVIVTVTGVAWIQAGAWRVSTGNAQGGSAPGSIAYPLAAVLTLLLVFQLLLRPGISF